MSLSIVHSLFSLPSSVLFMLLAFLSISLSLPAFRFILDRPIAQHARNCPSLIYLLVLYSVTACGSHLHAYIHGIDWGSFLEVVHDQNVVLYRFHPWWLVYVHTLWN